MLKRLWLSGLVPALVVSAVLCFAWVASASEGPVSILRSVAYGYSAGGMVLGQPAAGPALLTATEDIFVRGTNNGLWQNSWNGVSFGGWAQLTGVLTADPGAVSSSAISKHVFVRGTDYGLWVNNWNGTTWTWMSLGGVLTSGPDPDVQGSSTLDVYVTGTDNRALWRRTSSDDGVTWGAWESVGGGGTTDPGAVSWGAGRSDVFIGGNDNGLWHRGWTLAGGWGAWESLGGVITSAPTAASCTSGRMDVFVRGSDGSLWTRGYNGSWGAWAPLGGLYPSGAAAVCRPGSKIIDLFAQGVDDGALHWALAVNAT
jgi:hypothetical protein